MNHYFKKKTKKKQFIQYDVFSSNYSSSSSSVILPSVSGLHSPNSPHTQTQTPPMNLNNPLNNHPFSVSNLTGNHSNYSLTPPPSTPSGKTKTRKNKSNFKRMYEIYFFVFALQIASMPMNSLNSMNTYPNFMAAAMQQPLYINEFYEKTHPPIPDFFQKTSRQTTASVDPHLSSFYHSGRSNFQSDKRKKQ